MSGAPGTLDPAACGDSAHMKTSLCTSSFLGKPMAAWRQLQLQCPVVRAALCWSSAREEAWREAGRDGAIRVAGCSAVCLLGSRLWRLGRGALLSVKTGGESVSYDYFRGNQRSVAKSGAQPGCRDQQRGVLCVDFIQDAC